MKRRLSSLATPVVQCPHCTNLALEGDLRDGRCPDCDLHDALMADLEGRAGDLMWPRVPYLRPNGEILPTFRETRRDFEPAAEPLSPKDPR